MAMLLNKMFVNPPELEECRTYSEFKGKVKAWKGLTHVSEKQRGAVIAYNISNDSKFGQDLQDHIYDELDQEKLNDMEDGLDKVIKILDKHLLNTGMGLAAERFDAFLNVSRKSSQSIKQYIAQYEKVCKNYNETIGSLSQMAKALQLLRTAKLNDTQYEMILAMSEGNQNQDTIYDKIKTAVISQLTDKMNDVKGVVKETVTQAAFIVESDDDEETAHAKEVLAASFYKKQNWKKKQFFQQQQKQPYHQPKTSNQQQQYKQKYNGKQNNKQDQQQEEDERCLFCRSKTHGIRDCVQAKKMRNQFLSRKRNNGTYYTAAEITNQQADQEGETLDHESDNEGYPIGNVCLSENFLSENRLSRFTDEALGCAALDTCCSQTVCGKQWLNAYKAQIPKDLLHYVKGPSKAHQSFRFGDNNILKAEEKWTLPAYLGDKLITIEVYIIPSDIPMLLSKSDLQANDAILYMRNDKAKLNGTMVDLQTTTAGHYIVPLLKDHTSHVFAIEDILAINILTATPEEQQKHLHKLHKQFGHRPKQAFVDVLKHAKSWSSTFDKMLDKIIDSCEGCIIRRRNPDKPAVAMLMAKDVNDTVSMDLKILKNGNYILYMIDVFSRFTVAKIINRKKPEQVIDTLMEKWVSVFGTPSKFITDNGGEFSNEEMQLAADKLNIIHNTTGANSPWQNGLCERNHATVDNILEALEQDYSNIPLQTLLIWACVAKNSMLMVQGFSPYQIMFGRNPKLPNIITDPLPSWENEGISHTLTKHLEAMKATRKAFIESEDSKKLKLALEAKVRTNNTTHHNGDWVYFKKAGNDGWHNGKVVCQDGKVIFIRSGSFLYRCSANMVIKAGQELSKAQTRAEQSDSDTTEESDSETSKDGNDEPHTHPDALPTQSNTPNIPIPEKNIDQPNLESNQPDTDHTTVEDCNPNNQTDQQNEPEAQNEEENIQTPQPPKHQTKPLKSPKTSKKRTKPKTSKPNNLQFEIPKVQQDDLVECKIDGKWIQGLVTTRAGKATAKTKHCWNIDFPNDKQKWVDMSVTETRRILEEDILATWVHPEILVTMISPEKKKSPECLTAKLAELEKLKEFQTYEEIPNEGQEAISTTWVLTEKPEGIKARLTARGFEEESNVRSDSPTVQSTSMRFLFAVAATKEWKVNTIDIKSAFLQGKTLNRDVYIQPPREANSKGKLWKLYKCLYGLNDASKAWYDEMEARFDKHNFEKSCQDSAFFIYKEHGKIVGIVALHVDDFLFTGTKRFTDVIIPNLLQGLVIGKTEVGTFTYTGLHVTQEQSGIVLDQDEYLANIDIPTLEASRLKDSKSMLKPEEVTVYRQIMGKSNWVIRITRPDLGFYMVSLSSRFHKGTIDDVKEATKVLVKMQLNKSKIVIPNLDNFEDLEIWCFTDASKGNIDNTGSVGAFLIFLANKSTRQAAPIAWKAAKLKRVASSTLEAEVLAMKAGLVAAIGVQKIAQQVLGIHIPIIGVVDNYSSYESVKTNKQVEDARLKTELASIKEMLKDKHVEKVMWLQGNLMLADCMTKKGKLGLDLLQVMQSGYLGDSMEAANASEFVMTYNPSNDSKLREFIPQW
jgi:hypothetical protein